MSYCRYGWLKNVCIRTKRSSTSEGNENRHTHIQTDTHTHTHTQVHKILNFINVVLAAQIVNGWTCICWYCVQTAYWHFSDNRWPILKIKRCTAVSVKKGRVLSLDFMSADRRVGPDMYIICRLQVEDGAMVMLMELEQEQWLVKRHGR